LVVFLPFFIAITQSPPFVSDNVWALKMVVNDILKIARGIFGSDCAEELNREGAKGSAKMREERTISRFYLRVFLRVASRLRGS
jgi:hypothetical protein